MTSTLVVGNGDWQMMSLDERVEIVMGHAEFLADEAADVGCYHLTDRLRLGASRLAIDKEIVEHALLTVARTRAARAEKLVQLKAWNQRLVLELPKHAVDDEAAAFLATARLHAVATARFRLRRLQDTREPGLRTVVEALREAVAAAELAEDEHLAAVASDFIARARCNGRLAKLREDCERAKAELLGVLPPTAPAAARVRQRIVRTRRASTARAWRPDTTLEGVPVDA
jgi:hypothetical protein